MIKRECNLSAHPILVEQLWVNRLFIRIPGMGFPRFTTVRGIKGLYRGVDAAILRTGAGSAAQLPTYYLTKSFLLKHGLAKENSFSLNFISSIMAGLGVAIVMNPGMLC